MRNSKYLIILLLSFFPMQIFAQDGQTADISLAGLWKGTIFNDTTQKFYKYEIGIGEEKGKLIGYSYTWYDENNYFVVRKVKIKKKDGKIIIEDVDIVSYNFPEKQVQRVHKLHVLTLQVQDSVLVLTGPWATNRTKLYSPVTGTINLQRKNNYRRQSDLMAHLQELKLEEKLSFVAKDNEIARQEEEKKKEEEKLLTKTEAPVNASLPMAKANIKEQTIKKADTKKVSVELPKLPASTKPAAQVINNAPAAEVLSRKNVLQETMYFKTDSLVLTLYDNGEVDGDTVSVLMNGTIIMAKQGLSTNAIRKTIHISPGTDTVELVMYAESLGSIPPNTGLLVVRDGKDNYEVRFSGDFQRNAAIIFKRRKQ
ncbi:MAG: hypothetical protein ABIN36_09230 [Ferruginibacter sp.]